MSMENLRFLATLLVFIFRGIVLCYKVINKTKFFKTNALKHQHESWSLKFLQIIIAISFYHFINLSLRNSGAKHVGKKMLRQFQIFLVCLGNTSAKKLLRTQQKPLYIMSITASAYLGILPRTMIWFFNSWDYLFYLNYIVYL